MYENKLEFAGGGGGANKNLLWGGGSMDYGYFLELHVVNLNTFLDPVD